MIVLKSQRRMKFDKRNLSVSEPVHQTNYRNDNYIARIRRNDVPTKKDKSGLPEEVDVGEQRPGWVEAR